MKQPGRLAIGDRKKTEGRVVGGDGNVDRDPEFGMYVIAMLTVETRRPTKHRASGWQREETSLVVSRATAKRHNRRDTTEPKRREIVGISLPAFTWGVGFAQRFRKLLS